MILLSVSLAACVIGLCVAAAPVCGSLRTRCPRGAEMEADSPVVRYVEDLACSAGSVTLELCGPSIPVSRLVVHVVLYSEDGSEVERLETRPRSLLPRQTVQDRIGAIGLFPGTYRAAVLMDADGQWFGSWQVWNHLPVRANLPAAA